MTRAEALWKALLSAGMTRAVGVDLFLSRPWRQASEDARRASRAVGLALSSDPASVWDVFLRQELPRSSIEDLGALLGRRIPYANLPPKARTLVEKIAAEVPERPPSAETARKQAAVASLRAVIAKDSRGLASLAELSRARDIAARSGMPKTAEALSITIARREGQPGGGPGASDLTLPLAIITGSVGGALVLATRGRRRRW
jgi:hypothetical protein